MIELFVHATEPASRANGPGTRFVVWFQGCTLGCVGCFNPATHASEVGNRCTTDELVAQIAAASARDTIEGLTLSGGEPMQQPAAAVALLTAARGLALSTLMFSGYTKAEIACMPYGPEVLGLLDVLVDGRYQSEARLGQGLRGSANQQVHLLTPRYTEQDIAAAPLGEVKIAPDGSVVLTGVVPLKLKR